MSRGILLVLILASIIILVWSFSYLNKELFDPKGKRSAKTTARILKNFALPRGFKVLSNVKLKGQNGEDAVIENMLVGFFGILLIQTLGARGEYYGMLDGDSWSVALNGKKTALDNPVKALMQQEAALRALFARKKVYNIPIFRIAYISSTSVKTSLFVTHKGEILFGGKLSAYLGKSEFEKDTGLDVKQIVDSVLSD